MKARTRLCLSLLSLLVQTLITVWCIAAGRNGSGSILRSAQ